MRTVFAPTWLTSIISDKSHKPEVTMPPLVKINPSSSSIEEPVKPGANKPESQKIGLFTFLGLTIVGTQLFCEIVKQISNYSIQYLNNGSYPIPQTIIVFGNEIIKLVATIFRAKGKLPSFSKQSLKASFKFLLPSVLYAINNNVYFFGLKLVAPPVWMILTSSRTVVTASVYKFILKRHLTMRQFFGAFLIVISIAIAKTPDLVKLVYPSTSPGETLMRSETAVNQTEVTEENQISQVNSLPTLAIVLAFISACNSAGAAVYTEQLFKTGGTKNENFLDQQFWLYLYGGFVTLTVHFVTNPAYVLDDFVQDLAVTDWKIRSVIIIAMLFSSVGGVAIASILKYLDNIAKEYTGSVANIITAIACSFLFPDKFMLNIYIGLSMACLLLGIYFYEGKKKT